MLADLAAVFHWQPSEIRRLPYGEALEYRKLAIARALKLTGRRGRQ